jgi:hypothetical protein
LLVLSEVRSFNVTDCANTLMLNKKSIAEVIANFFI